MYLVRRSDKWNDLALKFDAHVHVALGACICPRDSILAPRYTLAPPVLFPNRSSCNLRKAKEVRDGIHFVKTCSGGKKRKGISGCQTRGSPPSSQATLFHVDHYHTIPSPARLDGTVHINVPTPQRKHPCTIICHEFRTCAPRGVSLAQLLLLSQRVANRRTSPESNSIHTG